MTNKSNALLSKIISNWDVGLVLLLLLPLFLFPVPNMHSWGGDFSLYIHQAINIVKGIPQNETGYIFNINNPSLSPITYPVGFPILLAPVIALFGNDLEVLFHFQTLFLFFIGLTSYLFFKKENGIYLGVLGVLMFVYEIWVLQIKNNILSDLPFTLFLVLSTFYYLYAKQKGKIIITGLLVGFTISIRTIGISILGGIAIYELILFLQQSKIDINLKNAKQKLGATSLITAIALGFYLFLHYVVFNTGGQGSYLDIIGSANELQIEAHARYYYQLFFRYIHQGRDPILSYIYSAFYVCLFIIGVVNCNKKQLLPFVIILIHVFIILVFPYVQGFRYLLPLIPFVIYYLLISLNTISISKNKKRLLIGIFSILYCTTHINEIKAIIPNLTNKQITSPQTASSKEAWDYIIKNTPKNAIFNFIKPRTFALYTNRKGICNGYNSPKIINTTFKTNHVDYILRNSMIPNWHVDEYLKKYGNQFNVVWNNDRYTLYKTNFN